MKPSMWFVLVVVAFLLLELFIFIVDIMPTWMAFILCVTTILYVTVRLMMWFGRK